MYKDTKQLKKLVFDVQVEAGEPATQSAESRTFSFIYGVAPEGLNDFEIAINDLKLGETTTLNLHEINIRTYFDRLFLIFSKQTDLIDINPSLRLKLTLRQVITPEASEVVTAMSEMLKSGSCSGDCDCGCSGH